jgi:hypothetical protein
MRGRAADELLRLPVRLHGIHVGYPVDVILAHDASRVLGLEVRCRDDTHRFLPLATAQVGTHEIAIGSALTLLDGSQLQYYRKVGSTLRSLRGHEVGRADAPSAQLKDVVVGEDGTIEALLVMQDGAMTSLPAMALPALPPSLTS